MEVLVLEQGLERKERLSGESQEEQSADGEVGSVWVLQKMRPGGQRGKHRKKETGAWKS